MDPPEIFQRRSSERQVDTLLSLNDMPRRSGVLLDWKIATYFKSMHKRMMDV